VHEEFFGKVISDKSLVWGLIKDPVSPLFFRQNDVRLRGNWGRVSELQDYRASLQGTGAL
jgi:hypothetical protein